MQTYNVHYVNITPLDAMLLCSVQRTRPYMVVFSGPQAQMQESVSEKMLVPSSWVWMGSKVYAPLDCRAERIDFQTSGGRTGSISWFAEFETVSGQGVGLASGLRLGVAGKNKQRRWGKAWKPLLVQSTVFWRYFYYWLELFSVIKWRIN